VTPAEASGEERLRLLQLLEVHDWRPSAVAAASGVHLATLYRRLERLGIRVKSARRAAAVLSPSPGL
jgi:transcriptional regulator of acetoin/glycerol metabolism